jgi:hypothetical protein
LLAGAAYATWYVLDEALGRGLLGQVASVIGGLAVGGLAYALAVRALGIPEARQIDRLLVGRLRREG